MFGCREERKREKSNERGRRHYLTDRGRINKGVRNENRSLISPRPTGSAHTAAKQAKVEAAASFFNSDVIHYIAYLLTFACGRTPPRIEIEGFLGECLAAIVAGMPRPFLRQRSLPERGG